MSKNFFFIVMAAGSGVRMGESLPKQFLPLKGVPILRRTIERLVSACPDAGVITVLPADYIEYWKNYCIESEFHQSQILVEGGITRFHSVKNALEKVPEGAIVAIHDGVRPLVSEALVRSMREKMNSCRALIPVLPSVDTLKILDRNSDGELVCSGEDVIDRSRVFGAQTPQMFRLEDIKAAYSQAFDLHFTDDGCVAAAKKIPLSFVEGERYNLKITTREDLILAEAILSLRP